MSSKESFDRPLPKRNRDDIDVNDTRIKRLEQLGILVVGYMINDGANIVTELLQYV